MTLERVSSAVPEMSGWVDSDPRLEHLELALPSSGDRAAAMPINNVMSPHLAMDHELLARAIHAIDISSERLATYDDWLDLLRAIWAAAGGDMQFFADVVWPWLEGNEANLAHGIEWAEEKWKSFTDSELGSPSLYRHLTWLARSLSG